MSARAMVSTHLVQGDGWWAREPRRRSRTPRGWQAWAERRASYRVETGAPPLAAPPVPAPAAPAEGPAGDLVPTPRRRTHVVDLREDSRWASLADQAGDLVAAGPRHRR